MDDDDDVIVKEAGEHLKWISAGLDERTHTCSTRFHSYRGRGRGPAFAGKVHV